MTEQWGQNDKIVPAGSDFGADDEVDQHGPLRRGWNRMTQSVDLTSKLATGDNKGAAENIAAMDTYQRQNPGSKEGKELSAAWQRGKGISGGIKEVGGEIAKDWREAKGFGAIRSLAGNASAMGAGVLEQIPNMVPPMAGMLAGGAAGSAVAPGVGTAAGAFAGASLGNTTVEAPGMVQDAMQKAGVNPQDQQATEAFIAQNGTDALKKAGIKGSIIGAVDTATMGLGHAILSAPARQAADRAIASLGIDAADKVAVKAAMDSGQVAAKMAADPVYTAARTGAGNVARNVGAASLEPAGEFTGEYVGHGVATGNYDEKDAFLEAVSSVGQGAATFAGQKAYGAVRYPSFGSKDAISDSPPAPGAAGLPPSAAKGREVPPGAAGLPTIDNNAIQEPGQTAPGMGYDPNAVTLDTLPTSGDLPVIHPSAGPLSAAASLLAGPDGVIQAPLPVLDEKALGKTPEGTGKKSQGTEKGQPAPQGQVAGQSTTATGQSQGNVVAPLDQSGLPLVTPAPASSEQPSTSQSPWPQQGQRQPSPSTGDLPQNSGSRPPVASATAPAQEQRPQPSAQAGSAAVDQSKSQSSPSPATTAAAGQETQGAPNQKPSEQASQPPVKAPIVPRETSTTKEKASAPETAEAIQGQTQRPKEPATQGPAPVDARGATAKPAASPTVENAAQGTAPAVPAVIDVKLAGMDLAIENPAESVRRNKPGSPVKWETTMKHHYGYIKGTIGNDKDHVDAFVKPDTPLDYSGTVYVVDQVNPDTGKFDEHKVMIGFDNGLQARQAYQANYAKGWKGFKAMTAMPMDEFKAWVFDGPKNKELASRGPAASDAWRNEGKSPDEMRAEKVAGLADELSGQVAAEAGEKDFAPSELPTAIERWAKDGNVPADELRQAFIKALDKRGLSDGRMKQIREALNPIKRAQQAPKKRPVNNLRRAAYDRNPMLTFLATHGLFHDKDKPGSQKSEFSPDKAVMVMGYGPVFRKTGLTPDVMVQRAIEEGYLPADGTEAQLTDLIRRAIGGEKILPMYAEGVADAEMERQMAARAELESERAQEDNAEVDPFAEEQAIEATRRMTDAELLALDDDIPWDAPGNASDEDFLRAMGATEQEIANELAEKQGVPQEGAQGRAGSQEGSASQAPGDRRQRDAQAGPGAEQEGLTAPTRADVLAQQDRAANAQALDDKAQIDKEAAAQTLTAQTAPEQRKDTSGDMFAMEKAQATIERRNKGGKMPEGPSLFDAPVESDSSQAPGNPDTLRAQADLQNALADLADIFGRNTRATIMPEQEQKLLPVLVKVFDAAFRLGYHKFKDAAKFALDQIRKALGDDAANAITLDHLQGAYISMAGGKTGVDTKRAVIGFESIEEITGTAAPAATEHKVGDLVKLTKPGVNGPVNIAGRIERILPDGRLEIRTQQDGIFKVAPSELGHKPTSTQTAPATPADGVTRAAAGGQFGKNGEWYEGGQILPTSEFTIKGAQTQPNGPRNDAPTTDTTVEVTPAATIAGSSLVVEQKTSQRGKVYWSVSGDTLTHKDLLDALGFAKPFRMGGKWSRSVFDADPTERLAQALQGNMPAPAPAAEELPSLPADEAAAVLRQNKLEIVAPRGDGQVNDGIWTVAGKGTFDAKDTIKKVGGRWNGQLKAWSFNADPTGTLAYALKERGGPGTAVDDAGPGESDAEIERRRELRQREDARDDERADAGDASKYVAADTQALILRGEKFGIPRVVLNEQIEDIGLIVNAHQKGKPLFLLANEAGTGKTMVLGGAIRELRTRGESKFVYVTMNTDLIAQIKKDLSDYGIDDVDFHTYSELSAKGFDTTGSILIFDEAHNVKNVGMETARANKAQDLIAQAKMTIMASATLFENPVEARYLASTGIFDSVGGFPEWAKMYGASVKVRKFYNPNTGRQQTEEIIYWAGRGKKEDGAAARAWLFKQAIMTQRAMKIEPGMVDVQFRRNAVDAKWVDLYDRVQEVYDAAIEAWTDENGMPRDAKIVSEIARHRENTVKRVLEASKTPFAIKDAQELLAAGRNVVIFVETKADRTLGKWRRSENFKDDTLYSYEQMREMMAEWKMEADAARMQNERAPQRPFAEFIYTLAGYFDAAGLVEELPSTSDQIVDALGADKVGIYTGSVSNAAAGKNKADFLAGRKKVLVATMAKGGTGLSLHDVVGNRPTTQLNINLPWKATGVDQVAARVARYGLRSKTEVRWLFASNIPWESQKLAPRVGARMRDMGAIVKGIEVKAAEVLDGNFDFEGDLDVKGGSSIGQQDEGDIYAKAVRMEKLRRKADDTSGGFFETPFPLAALMTKVSGVRAGHSLLEPSAGRGNLLRLLPDGVSITAVEQREDNHFVVSKRHPDATVQRGDFMEFEGEQYDTILMNPPFERVAGIGAQDVAHVQRAYGMLKDGGRMAAIMGEGAFFRDYKQEQEFREWLDDVGATVIQMPEGAFKQSGTGVRTRMVIIDKNGESGRTDLNLQDMDPASLKAIEALVPSRHAVESAAIARDGAARYDVNEPDAPYETDIFGDPLPQAQRSAAQARPARTGVRGDVQPAAGVQDTPAPPGEYFTNTIVGSEVSRELGASKVTTPEQAATATQYLYRSAVERLDGIVTDKDGNVLGVVGGFKGALSQASVYPATLVGEAVRIPGAANIWFSHNHPSGVSTLSRADQALNETLSDVFRGSGIEPKGLLAVTGDKFSYTSVNPREPMINGRQVIKSVVRKKVPVIERELGDGSPGVSITDPLHAKQVAGAHYDRAKSPGIILMNAQNQVVAWIPVPNEMTGPLRGTGQLNAIYRAVSQANAGAAIIVHGGELSHQSLPSKYPRVTPAENIGAALKKIDVNPLDIIDATTGRSAAERGDMTADGPVYARSPFYSALTAEVGKIAAKSQPAMGWAMNINGLVKAGKVKQDEVNWTGVLDWLRLQEGKVTREQIGAYLDANGVQVEETVLEEADNRQMDPDEIRSDLLTEYQGRDTAWLRTYYEAELDQAPPSGYSRNDLIADIVDAKMSYYESNPDDYSPAKTRAGATKYGQYQLPGGTNYREVLLTLPKRPGRYEVRNAEGKWRIWNNEADDWARRPDGKILTGYDTEQDARRGMSVMGGSEANNFRSGHWDQPNVLAHIRVNDRTDADGKKVLFVEEIQSDWGQSGKKQGFDTKADKAKRAELQAEHNRLQEEAFDLQRGKNYGDLTIEESGRLGKIRGRILQINDEMPTRGTPEAPFVTKTDAWLSLALKRIVKMAADGGYDRVAFVNGEQSAERYDLSKQVRSIVWTGRGNDTEKRVTITPNDGNDIEFMVQPDGAVGAMGRGSIGNEFDGKRLDDIVGKDVAERIMGDPYGDMRGNGLKVGGEGMKAFYDKIVPNTLKDVLKKLGGGALETVSVTSASSPYPRSFQSRAEADAYADANLGDHDYTVRGLSESEGTYSVYDEFDHRFVPADRTLKQPGFTLSDAILAKASEDLPQFSRDKGAGVNMQDAKAIVAAVREALPTAPPIHILESINKAPKELKADIIKAGAQNDVDAAFHNGEIYVFPNNIASIERMAFVLAHHEIRHYGFRSMLGPKAGPIFLAIHATNANVRAAAAEQVAKGYAKSRVLAVEEALADMPVEELANLNGFDRLIAALRNWLRSVAANLRRRGFAGLADAVDPKVWTDKDVAALIARAEGVSRGGAARYRTPGTVFAADVVPFQSGKPGGNPGGDVERFERLAQQVRDEYSASGSTMTFDQYKEKIDPIHDKLFEAQRRLRKWQEGRAAESIEDVFPGYQEIPIGTKIMAVHGIRFKEPTRATVIGRAGSRVGDKAWILPVVDFGDGNGRTILPGDIKEVFAGPKASSNSNTQFARSGGFASAKAMSDVTNTLREATRPIGTVSWWDKSIGTQYHKSTKDRDFKRVFDGYVQQTDDTAHYAIEAERLAPSILKRLESIGDAFQGLRQSGKAHMADLQAVSRALFANIEGEEGIKQVRFDDQTLRQSYNLTPKQIEMYHQARAAVDTSVERLAQTYTAQLGEDQGMDINRVKNMDLDDTAAIVKQFIQDSHDEARAAAALRKNVAIEDQDPAMDETRALEKEYGKGKPKAPTEQETAALLARVDGMVDHARFLQQSGYMPALRFGQFAVTVTDDEGQTLHFEMFESQLAANLASMKLRKQYPGAAVAKSVMNPEQYAMFKGVSPETVELFAKFTGMDQNEAYQDYIALAKSARSVKMRQLKRKGIAGFSEDATRVLASFLTSNARQSAVNMNVGAITDALASKDLARKGDVQREAQKLHEYMGNPIEEARRLRSFMFMHFMGGSIASALVNLTQPIMQTAPYLHQFSGSKTAGIMAASAKMAVTGKIADAELRDAAERAAQDGITEPHEIHQLMADASGASFGGNLRARAAVKLWGSFFATAEAYNRRITFLAAYQVAKQTGQGNAYEFARKAVIETQGLYAKVNRPNWSRGAVGATIFTFKQFSIAYLEWFSRLPPKQKVLAMAILLIAAGADGLPFAEDLQDVIDTIGQSMGYNTNSKKWQRKALAEAFGNDMGEILNTGLLSKSAIDVQGRLGMGNLIPGTELFKPSETNKARSVSEIAGPVSGIIDAFQKALSKAQRGEIVGMTGAFHELAPVAVKNLLKGIDMAKTGIYKDSRGYKVADVDVVDSFVKMLGLQPSSIARNTRKFVDELQDKGMVTMMESMIADQWAQGIAQKDPDQVAAARKALASWNENNPGSRIIIKPQQLNRRVQQMDKTRSERFVKTVPKELRAGVARELAQ